MPRLDELPPDQRAALSLLLSQRQSYAQVAALLRIDERAVHDRAHAALAVLAPREARALEPHDREQIGDYLLGQRGGLAERLRARSLLDGSQEGRAWARAVSAELAPLTSEPLPEIPREISDNGALPPARGATASAPSGAGAGGGTPPSGGVPRSPLSGGRPREISRRGGAVLLGAIAAAAVAVILIVVLSGGNSPRRARASTAPSASSGSGSGTGAGAPASAARASETKRLTLLPTDPSSKAVGVVAVLAEGGTYAFYLAAEHLPPSHGFFYAVWLYNSATSYEALSKSPPVGSDGRMQGGSLLPSNAGSYHHMILTRETSEHPGRPGLIVLSGPFALR